MTIANKRSIFDQVDLPEEAYLPSEREIDNSPDFSMDDCEDINQCQMISGKRYIQLYCIIS